MEKDSLKKTIRVKFKEDHKPDRTLAEKLLAEV